MAQLFDISNDDVYNPLTIAPEELDQDAALSQALKNFIMSGPDDYFYTNSGGLIRQSMFKILSLKNAAILKFRLKNAIVNEFSPAISLAGISLDPDPNNHLWKITIAYYSPYTGNIVQTPIFVKDLSDRERDFALQSVPYVGDNLIRFAQQQKAMNPNRRMILDSTSNTYVFGKYSMANLTNTMPEYAQVLQIFNGS